MSDEKEKGLVKKYIISHSDGTVTDPDARYFVLRYDGGGRDPIHTRACRAALLTYAGAIQDHLPLLASDLRKQIIRELRKK